MPRYLTDVQVIGILADHEAGLSAIRIAAKYGISRENVYQIVTGRTHRKLIARWEADHDGTTEAELDALIAEQLPTMPREPRYERQADHVPQAVSRGLGLQATQRRMPGAN